MSAEKLKIIEKLFSIDDAEKVLLDLGVCKDLVEAEVEIERYTRQHAVVIPNGVYAAFWKVLDTASITPGIGKTFEERLGAPFNRTNLKEKAFGGFNIDPQRANLPDKNP
ncbi:MAG: hypothetical protein Q8O68_00065 [Candidatus Daviesbacteria bacterium]|nr:hypothetical protein [Candidatus Daviesbacteria bacterium]